MCQVLSNYFPGVKDTISRHPLTLPAAASVAGALTHQAVAGAQSQMRFGWIACMLIFVSILISVVARRYRAKDLPSRQDHHPTSPWTIAWLLLLGSALMFVRTHWSASLYHQASLTQLLQSEDGPSAPIQPAILNVQLDGPTRLLRNPIDESFGWLDGNEETSYRTLLIANVITMRGDDAAVPVDGRVMIIVDGDCSDWLPGDQLCVHGQLSTCNTNSNPGQRNSLTWAIRNDIHAFVSVDSIDDIKVLQPPRLSWLENTHRIIAKGAFSAREQLLKRLSPDQKGIAVALVLGQRDLLDNDKSEALLVTGTAHLLSVSGLHLGIILILAKLVAHLFRMPAPANIFFLVIVTLFYVLMTGCRMPVIRAAVLMMTVLTATTVGRPRQGINALALAAILLAWWRPLEINAIGMQLSFLAVATLLACGRIDLKSTTAASQAEDLEQQFDQLVDRSRGRFSRTVRILARRLTLALWYSSCVTLMTLPIIWHTFHVVSPVSIFANVILSPLMVVALSSGVATVLAGWSISSLAFIPASVCGFTLGIMQWIISVAQAVPLGHFWLPSPSLLWIASFYVGIGFILALSRRGHRRKPVLTWFVCWLTIAISTATHPEHVAPNSLEATFLDVGHGTAVIIRDENQCWLYDCGWMGNLESNSRKIDQALWQLGIVHLDGVFLSHNDTDHYSALPGLISKFSIGRVVAPPGMLDRERATKNREVSLLRTINALDKAGIPVTAWHRGQPGGEAKPWLAGWLRWTTVLHPPRVRIPGSDNANSLVLQIDCPGGRCLLLPGDLEPPGTSIVTETPRPNPGLVMMAPHHGSLKMNAPAVLQWARPESVIVSGGRRAGSPEVREMLSRFGSDVWVTHEVGAIRVTIDADGELEIRSWLQSPW